MSNANLATSVMVYNVLQSKTTLKISHCYIVETLMYLCGHLHCITHSNPYVCAGEGDGGQAEAVRHQ